MLRVAFVLRSTEIQPVSLDLFSPDVYQAVRRARLVPRIVLPWRVVICALGHDVLCSLALANPVWGDGHYRPSCAPRSRLSSAHLSPSHGPGPPCPPPNPVGRGRILLLEILQITLSAEPFLAAVGVPPGGWYRADHENRGLLVVRVTSCADLTSAQRTV